MGWDWWEAMRWHVWRGTRSPRFINHYLKMPSAPRYGPLIVCYRLIHQWGEKIRFFNINVSQLAPQLLSDIFSQSIRVPCFPSLQGRVSTRSPYFAIVFMAKNIDITVYISVESPLHWRRGEQTAASAAAYPVNPVSSPSASSSWSL